MKKKETVKSFLHFLVSFHVNYPEPIKIPDKQKALIKQT